MDIVDINSSRKTKQIVLYNLYHNEPDRYIRSTLADRLKEDQKIEAYSKYIAPQRNVLRKIVDLLSVSYKTPVQRRFKNEKLNKYLKEKVENLDPVMNTVEKMIRLFGDIFLMFYHSKQENKIKTFIIFPHSVDIKANLNDLEYIEYLSTVPEYPDAKKERFYFDGRREILDKNGVILKQEKLLTRSPVVWFSVGVNKNWAINDQLDILNGQIEIGVNETYHSFTSFLRSFKQLIRKPSPDNPEDKSVVVGPNKLIDGEFTTLDLADVSGQYLETIRMTEKDLAGSRGISALSYYEGNEGTDKFNGITQELKFRWSESTLQMRLFEKSAAPALISMINYSFQENFDLEEELIVDFQPNYSTLDDDIKLMDYLEKAVKLGVDDPVEIIKRRNPDLTTEEAEERFQYYLKRRRIYLEMLSQGNTTAELQGTLSPEENGAMGKASVGKDETEKALIKAEASNEHDKQVLG